MIKTINSQTTKGKLVYSSRQANVLLRKEIKRKDINAFNTMPDSSVIERVCKNGYKAFNVTCLVFTKNGVIPVVVQVPVNRESPYIEHLVHPQLIISKGGAPVMYERYTEAFLNVMVETETDLGWFANRIYKVKDNNNLDLFLTKLPDNTYQDLVSGQIFESSIITDEEGYIKDDVIVYNDHEIGCQTATNGQVKKKQMTLPACNLEGFDPQKLMNKMTFGGFDILVKAGSQCKENDAESKRAKEIAQDSTRIAQHKAPAVELMNIRTAAFFMGKISNEKFEYFDGSFFIDEEYVADAFTAKTNNRYNVLPQAVRGLAIQSRPWLVKGLGRVVEQDKIKEFIKDHNWEIVPLYRNEISQKDQDEFVTTVLSKGKKGKFAGKCVVIYPSRKHQSDKLDILADLNALKAPFDLTTNSGLNVLEISHSSGELDNEVTTSTQMLNSLFAIDEERATELVTSLAEKTVARKREILNKDEGIAPHASELASDVVNYTILGASLFPKFVRENWRPSFKSFVDKTLQGLTNKCANLNFKTDGMYVMIIPDPAMDYGINVLDDGNDGPTEIFSNMANIVGIKEGVGYKYPKMHYLEYSNERFLNVDEYMAKAKEKGLSADKLKLLRREIEALNPGVICVPAYKGFFARHAGADCDGDDKQIHTNKTIIEISKKANPLAVNIID